MARAYSLDLRERVVAAVGDGQSSRQVARLFRVSVASVVKWAQRSRATGSPAARPMGGRGRGFSRRCRAGNRRRLYVPDNRGPGICRGLCFCRGSGVLLDSLRRSTSCIHAVVSRRERGQVVPADAVVSSCASLPPLHPAHVRQVVGDALVAVDAGGAS